MITEYFSGLPALSIDGAKAVGKTVTASRYAKQILRLDIDENIDLLGGGLSVLREQEKPLLIDEWQRYPQSWDYVRRLVDEDYSSGQYLLTGSAVPRKVKTHSGAGRIVRLRMRPLSLAERELEEPKISLSSLLDNSVDEVSGASMLNLTDYIREITASGFPGLRHLSENLREVQLDSYLTNIADKEFPENDIIVRKPDILTKWLIAYAAATATTTSYEKILVASTAGEAQKPSKSTTLSYRDALDSLFITDRVDAWLPTMNTFSSLGKSPKHFLADPALTARLLHISTKQLITGAATAMLQPEKGTTLGRLFEALIALSLQSYAQANSAQLRHFRSSKGDREVDFIIEKGFSVVAVEAKTSASITSEDVKHLNWLAKTYPDYSITRIVLNTGKFAYTRKDGVHVIPAALLGA